MAKNRTMWRLMMLAAAVGGFALINAGCVSSAPPEDYVPANWTMEETEEIYFFDYDSGEQMSRSSGADAQAIQSLAESSQAKDDVWYVYTAPEREGFLYYSYKWTPPPSGGSAKPSARWSIIKVTVPNNRGEYLPAYTVGIPASPPSLNSVVEIKLPIVLGSIQPGQLRKLKDEDDRAAVYAISLLDLEHSNLQDSSSPSETSPAGFFVLKQADKTYYFRVSTKKSGILSLSEYTAYRLK